MRMPGRRRGRRRVHVRFGQQGGGFVVDARRPSRSRPSAGRGGNSPQENCSSSEKGAVTMNQLSIEPVGQGETQSMQKLHVPTSTT